MYGFRSKVALLPTSKSMDSFLVLIYSLGNDLPSSFENLTSVANTGLCLIVTSSLVTRWKGGWLGMKWDSQLRIKIRDGHNRSAGAWQHSRSRSRTDAN